MRVANEPTACNQRCVFLTVGYQNLANNHWRYTPCFDDIFLTVNQLQTVDQLQTAGLLQECVMVRDGLAHLPDGFTTGDMSFIACYLCTC